MSKMVHEFFWFGFQIVALSLTINSPRTAPTEIGEKADLRLSGREGGGKYGVPH
jgi:hypothetical protein